MVRMMNSFILFKVCLILVAVIQRAYLKKDHPKESHDPYCLFKKKSSIQNTRYSKTSPCSLELGDLNVLKTSLLELELENYFS